MLYFKSQVCFKIPINLNKGPQLRENLQVAIAIYLVNINAQTEFCKISRENENLTSIKAHNPLNNCEE